MTTKPPECLECGAVPGQPHLTACSFHERFVAAGGPVAEWLASLPAEYERLKARAAQVAWPEQDTGTSSDVSLAA